jgi:hypothetical protein
MKEFGVVAAGAALGHALKDATIFYWSLFVAVII